MLFECMWITYSLFQLYADVFQFVDSEILHSGLQVKFGPGAILYHRSDPPSPTLTQNTPGTLEPSMAQSAGAP